MKKKLKKHVDVRLAEIRLGRIFNSVSLVENDVDAGNALHEVATTQRKIDSIKKGLNEEIETLRQEAEREARVYSIRVAKLVDDLALYGEQNRERLTRGGKRKTVKYPTGQILWRLTPPSVRIRSTKLVLAQLKERGLREMVRVKETIDRLMMLRYPKRVATIKGVAIVRREEFVVKPSHYKVQIARDVASLKRRARAKRD